MHAFCIDWIFKLGTLRLEQSWVSQCFPPKQILCGEFDFVNYILTEVIQS